MKKQYNIYRYDEIYCIVLTNYHKILFHHLKQELKPFLEHKNILFNYIELNLRSHKNNALN